MNKIAILHQPRIPASKPMAKEVGAWLQAQGIACSMGSTWKEIVANNGGSSDFFLLIVLGGDGSTLRVAHMTIEYPIPIFGINMGRVGFLSEAQPDDWRERLARVLQGDYWIERRLTLRADLLRNGQVINSYFALNEVVIGRGQQARVIRLHLRVDGDLVTTYTADALIVATPTGSTAYAMAAGGPLLPPQLKNFVVVPVAAHLSLNRPLILHEEAEISIKVEMDHEANLTADGQYGGEIENGDLIVVKRHIHDAHFARVDSSGYFYRRLMQRLGFSWPHK